MRKLKNLFENNKRWAARTSENDPEFFKILSMQQNPEYLYSKLTVPFRRHPSFLDNRHYCVSDAAPQIYGYCLR